MPLSPRLRSRRATVAAQDSTSAAVQPAAASQPVPQLSYGVPQVLQLEQAKVSDGVIVNYIQNSGTIYSLKADEIVYLKQQGVSDNVLNAMLNQRSRLTGSAPPAAPIASSTVASDQVPAPAAPATTYVQTAPPATVYVIPDTQTYLYDTYYYSAYPYYSYPYYGGYYYGWPAVSLSFGWGGHYGGGYHGGGEIRGGGGGLRGGGGGIRGGGGGFRGGGGGRR